MGKVVLARVDARLIHGQVMTSLSKSAGQLRYLSQMIQRHTIRLQRTSFCGAGSRTGLKVRDFEGGRCCTILE